MVISLKVVVVLMFTVPVMSAPELKLLLLKLRLVSVMLQGLFVPVSSQAAKNNELTQKANMAKSRKDEPICFILIFFILLIWQ